MTSPDDRAQAFSRIVERHRAGDHAAAIAGYQQLLDADPGFHDARLNLGAAYVATGRHDEAEAAYKTILADQPKHAGAHYNFGNLCRDRGQRKPAEQHYLAALHAEPLNIGVMVNLGQLFIDTDRLEEARRLLAKATRHAPGNPAVWNALAIAHMNANRLPAAATCFRRALAISPGSAGAWTNLGSCYRMTGQLEEAITCHNNALARQPENAKAWTNLGVTQVDFNAIEAALASYNRALSINPQSTAAIFNRGVARLLNGDFRQGFEDYRIRWQRPDIPDLPDGAPFWEGEDLKGCRLLLFSEQGFGDTLQFVRYAPLLQARGAEVILHCQRALGRLLATAPGLSAVVPRHDPPPPHDLRAALLELPRLMETAPETIPFADGYLPRPAAVPVTGDRRLRVGIVWAGSPSHKNDSKRSCGLGGLFCLFGIPGVDLFSLQFGKAAAALGTAELALVQNAVAGCTDFLDTAGVVSGLDLVITVDTSVAHLAGALG
ncbi:MAG: tetratricopeptide repeat protein, partial [Rhodospirillales bacterium]